MPRLVGDQVADAIVRRADKRQILFAGDGPRWIELTPLKALTREQAREDRNLTHLEPLDVIDEGDREPVDVAAPDVGEIRQEYRASRELLPGGKEPADEGGLAATLDGAEDDLHQMVRHHPAEKLLFNLPHELFKDGAGHGSGEVEDAGTQAILRSVSGRTLDLGQTSPKKRFRDGQEMRPCTPSTIAARAEISAALLGTPYWSEHVSLAARKGCRRNRTQTRLSPAVHPSPP
jgi:hypothetical protein